MLKVKFIFFFYFVAHSVAVNYFVCNENKVSAPFTPICTISNMQLDDRSFENNTVISRANYKANTIVFEKSTINIFPPQLFALEPEKIFIERVHLNQIIPGTFRDAKALKEFHARDNYVGILRNKTFMGAKNLEVIDLAKNELGTIDVDAFYDLPNLRTLILNDNFIDTINSEWFRFSHKFEHILIGGGNKIAGPSVVDFEAQEQLKTLDISTLQLESLKVKLDCRNIEVIDASRNTELKLLEISCKNPSARPVVLHAELVQTFEKKPSLAIDQKLKVDHLNVDLFSLMNTKEFSFIDSLKHLTINSGQLVVEELYGSFEHLPKDLESLKLYGRIMPYLNGTLFDRLTGLKVLDLSGLGLRALHLDTFQPHVKLEELYLQNNQLEEYIKGTDILKAFPKLKVIDLRQYYHYDPESMDSLTKSLEGVGAMLIM